MRIILLLLIFCSPALAIVSDPIEQIVVKLAGGGSPADLSLITPQNTASVMAKLRQVANGKRWQQLGTALVCNDRARVILIRLGDMPTIEKMVSKFEQYDSPYAVNEIPDLLLESRQPLVISALARSFFVNDDATKAVVFDEDVIGPTRSIWAGVLVTRIIRRCAEFTPELQAWAQEMEQFRGEDPKCFREAMQVWSKENARAFESRKFAAVKPLSERAAPAPNVQPARSEVSPTIPTAARLKMVATPVTQPTSTDL